jgi:AcrR family transcriptional regulator
MRAAEKLFTSRRFHEITLEDIVREAHVGKGTIYTYFKDKDDLFLQVAISGFDELCDLVRQRVTSEAPFREQLRQVCEAISAFFQRRRQLFRMMQSEDARMPWCGGRTGQQWMEKRRELVSALGPVMKRGQDERLARDDLPPETLAMLLLGLLRTRGRMLREAGMAMDDEMLVDLFLSGAGRGRQARRRPDPSAAKGARA